MPHAPKKPSMPLLFALCLFLSLLLAAAPRLLHAAEAPQKTVRVGYYEQTVFQEGGRPGAIRRGYAYEYYRKIAEYTGWRYEYVYGSFGELYEKFMRGEVDLLAGLAWKKERADIIGYPAASMGRTSYNLLKHASDRSITDSPASLSGKKLGVLESALAGALNRYMARKVVLAEIVSYKDFKSLFSDFYARKLDAIAVEGDGTPRLNDIEALPAFDTVDYYLCVTASRPDLLKELNDAQKSLRADEPFFIDTLRSKYYSSSMTSLALSHAEKHWLESHGTLRVGCLKNYLPYSDANSSGEVKGLVRTIVPAMLSSMNLGGIKVEFTAFSSYDSMMEAMTGGQVDTVFPVGGGLYYSEENGLFQSIPVISSSSELIYKGHFDESMTKSFAVNEKNSMQLYYMKSNFPQAKIILYPSIDACLAAVLNGEAGCTTLNGLRANDLLKNRRYRGLSFRHVNSYDDRCFGVPLGNDGLLKLLNRGIRAVGANFIQKEAYANSSELFTYSTLDLIADNMWIFGSSALALALILLAFFIYDSKRAKRLMREAESARAKLQETNAKLEHSRQELEETDAIIAKAGFGIWHIIVEEGKRRRMQSNAKMLEVLELSTSGLSEEETYAYWQDGVLEEDLPAVLDSFDQMMQGRLAEITYRWKHPKKGVIYVRSGGTAKKTGENAFDLSGYHSEVTESVRADRQREEALASALHAAETASRAKTTFLNNMSHDIRTPMNAIVGFTSLAASHLDSKDLVRDYLGKIAVSSQHLLSLINDVLDMSRIESGKVQLEESEVHIPDIIHDIRSIIQNSIAAKRQEFSVEAQDIATEDILTDKLRLNQVLINILSNAVKFTPEGGTISLHITEKPSPKEGIALFEFRIRDNGIGMSQEFQKTIFDPFTREQNSTVSGIQGTGLGMAITKNIVDLMGGTICVQSTEGKGTEFTLELPFRMNSSKKQFAFPRETGGMHVLVADADSAALLSACSLLQDAGMLADGACSAADAIRLTREAVAGGTPFGAFLIDRHLPGMDSIELVRTMRRDIAFAAPIFLLSASDWSGMERQAMEAGATGFCSKPVFLSELCRLFTQHFGSGGEGNDIVQHAMEGRRILLAEDNELNQQIALTLLEEAGFVVDIACDGAEAVERMEASPAGHYDAILMDVQMPRMGGYEATRRIRSLSDVQKSGIPIIAVTANAFEEDRKSAREAGMDAHLAKPYDMHTMLETICGVIAMRDAARNNHRE